MPLEHPFVARSWITYEVTKDGGITTILNVDSTMPLHKSSGLEGSLADAIVRYMTENDYIDRTLVTPRNAS